MFFVFKNDILFAYRDRPFFNERKTRFPILVPIIKRYGIDTPTRPDKYRIGHSQSLLSAFQDHCRFVRQSPQNGALAGMS